MRNNQMRLHLRGGHGAGWRRTAAHRSREWAQQGGGSADRCKVQHLPADLGKRPRKPDWRVKFSDARVCVCRMSQTESAECLMSSCLSGVSIRARTVTCIQMPRWNSVRLDPTASETGEVWVVGGGRLAPPRCILLQCLAMERS